MNIEDYVKEVRAHLSCLKLREGTIEAIVLMIKVAWRSGEAEALRDLLNK